MSLNDLILFAVLFGSVTTGVCVPRLGEVFQPYLTPFIMILLFLSFLRLDFSALLDTSRAALLRLAALASVKLIVLPVVLYAGALVVLPDYAIPILLLSGISTGVVAPFVASLLAVDIAPVLRMVIVTSVLVPFSLPSLVKLLAGTEITIPLGTMVQLLALVIFLPMVLVLVLRQVASGVLDAISERHFPVSLVLLILVNLAVFSKYSEFFFHHPGLILASVAVAYVLSAIYYLTGYLMSPGTATRERMASGVSLALMNNVLVIVFSSQFFGPMSPTLAAMYMFPFYTIIVPIRMLAARSELRAGGNERKQ